MLLGGVSHTWPVAAAAAPTASIAGGGDRRLTGRPGLRLRNGHVTTSTIAEGGGDRTIEGSTPKREEPLHEERLAGHALEGIGEQRPRDDITILVAVPQDLAVSSSGEDHLATGDRGRTLDRVVEVHLGDSQHRLEGGGDATK